MMNSEELQIRIDKLNVKISKIQKRIDKWTENYSSQKAFEKEYSWVNNFEDRKEYYLDRWKDNCNDELHYAQRDLEDAMTTLNKYNNALLLVQERENRPVIQIFKDFFDKWKQEIKDFTEPLYQKYLDLDRQLCDYHNKRYALLQTMTEEEYKEKYNELRAAERELLNITWVSLRREKGKSDFDKFLDKYMLDRYYELVEKVTKVTGNITDVSRLYVGHDGSINGIIIGDNGTAKIETIIAGGYNIQCLHYRVLVHEVR